MSQIALRMEHITVAYREGFVAINDAGIELEKGSIHGLLGENGAGKSTFVKLLCGVLSPDAGQIFLNEKPFSALNPADAARRGIIKLQKQSDLVPSLTVAENITLGDKQNSFWLEPEEGVEITNQLAQQFGIELDPNAIAAHLSEEDTLETELLKAVHHKVQVLIIDEPSTHVSMGQIGYLFQMLRRLADSGITVLYVTNRPDEVVHLCDRVTVMADGTTRQTMLVSETSQAQLKMLMASGRPRLKPVRTPFKPKREVLRITDLATFREPGKPALEDLDLVVREGEIVAVMGNADSGARQLCDAIAGLLKTVGGSVRLFDENITKDGMAGTRQLGVSFLINDPNTSGIAPRLSIQENLLPNQYTNPAYLKDGLLDGEKLRRRAEKLVEEYQIKCDSVEDMASTLSQASARKLLFARECSSEPVLLVAYRPTAATSTNNAALMRRKLIALRDEGAAILLVPTDLEEYQQLADTTLVLHQGRVAAYCEGLLEPSELDAYMTTPAQPANDEMEAKKP
ncbi:MAG: ATP-binding cassette domain-containing protein [Pygmaiobacter massiliensis]|nr:ATP-binding cassette domain-containing protein [Pygmaiobacter massiliensis]